MITNKNKVQPLMFNQQEEKNYDKGFLVKMFEGTERFAKQQFLNRFLSKIDM